MNYEHHASDPPAPTHRVVVCVFRGTRRGPRYLLVRQDQEHEGLWRPITGTVRPEEVLEAAAVREVREETGIVGPQQLVDFGFRHCEQVGDLDLVEWGLGYDVGSSEPRVRLGPSYRDYRWLDFEDAYKTVELPPLREAVLRLHLRLFG
jgi:8-oxo-dGTP pyrophosphatase MutT (NUDIX family)